MNLYIPETYGSSAYAPVYAPQKEEHREAQSDIQKKSRRRVTMKAKRLFVLGTVWACAILLLVRYAILTEQCRQVEALTAQLSETHAAVVQEELILNKEINLAYVEEYATTKLGMVRPSAAQEVYITIRQDDAGEVLSDTQASGVFASLGSRILRALEYLY